MKNTLKLSLLLIALTATACSKYETANKDAAPAEQPTADSLTYNNNKMRVAGDSSKIVFENNVYRSAMTAEG